MIIDGISYIPSTSLLTGIPKLSFKDDRAFGVVDPRGEAPRMYSPGSELGFYFNDTRYLAIWETTFNGTAPIALANELRYGGSTLVHSMTNKDMIDLETRERIPRDTLLIRRILSFHGDTLYETLALRNFATQPLTLQLECWAGGSFDDIFEVRGFPRAKRGQMLAPSERADERGHRVTTMSYHGLDGRARCTHVHRLFAVEKIRLSPSLCGHFARVTVPPKGDLALKTVVSFDQPSDATIRGQKFHDLSVQETLSLIAGGSHQQFMTAVDIETDNAIVNRAIHSARVDIRMLLTLEETLTLYPYAGIPWFSAPFGRDGLITAYQLLPWHPELARGVLEYAFATLGKQVDEFTDEQPGKVFHEMRRGEMSATREVPFIPYYGSVDSTPLALILLHEYVKWTMDLDHLREWWPQALRALEWIDKWGDSNGDGFLDYARMTTTGLVNQGWKDSHDSVMHADGRLAPVPIALCEVQAYAYRAKLGMSALASLLGEHVLSARLRFEALQLKAGFSDRYWDGKRGFVYLALDGQGRPCEVLSSNMGHCLWGEVLTPEQASSVTSHLVSDAMFSGHGIRTLADTEAAYNPLSYHNGSVWPHDNSLILEGLRNYGETSALEKVATGLIGVLETSHDFRLPELFCGFRKRGSEPPVPYEVACKPQAWAAGSVFLLLKAMLGISMDSDQQHLVFRSPLLTSKIGRLDVRNLHGRDWDMDFTLERGHHGAYLDVKRKTGKVRVLTVK